AGAPPPPPDGRPWRSRGPEVDGRLWTPPGARWRLVNTLKNRAHRLSYRIAVSRLLRDGSLSEPERRLAARVLDHLDYVDYARAYLFTEAAQLLGHCERPAALARLGN